MTPRTYQSSKTKKTPSQTRMHAFREPISCRGLGCEVEFLPKRKDQVFCSPVCRSEYFKIARGIGSILLEKSKSDSRLKVIVDGLLEILKTSGQSEETE
jgi:hypothetical protein